MNRNMENFEVTSQEDFKAVEGGVLVNTEVLKSKNSLEALNSIKAIDDNILFHEEREKLFPITEAFKNEEIKISISLEKQCLIFLEAMRILKADGKRVRVYYTQELKITKDKASLLVKRAALYKLAEEQANIVESKEYVSSLSDATVKLITKSCFKDRLVLILTNKLLVGDIKKLYREEISKVTTNNKTKKKKKERLIKKGEIIAPSPSPEVLDYKSKMAKRLEELTVSAVNK